MVFNRNGGRDLSSHVCERVAFLTHGLFPVLRGSANYTALAIRGLLDQTTILDDWRNVGDPNAVDASGNNAFAGVTDFNDFWEGDEL